MPKLFYYIENEGSHNGAIILLTGRGNYGYDMVRDYCRALDFSSVALVSVQPRIDTGWYPPPNGPLDQQEAVEGLADARRSIDQIIRKVERKLGFERKQIFISGFSMGGVAAVNWATHTDDPVAGVICHSGAILEPQNVPEAKHDMPIILNHGMDDNCFQWEERYLPMRRALKNRNYHLVLAERNDGGHQITENDVACLNPLFEKTFGCDLSWKPLWKQS